tara:strand:+ start:17303 stop:17482 length:180 start_codon:yes stop_codon:yes gene_type:complete
LLNLSDKTMKIRSRRRRKLAWLRRRGNDDAATAMSRGIVTVSICAGAGMWGYAMINLAT